MLLSRPKKRKTASEKRLILFKNGNAFSIPAHRLQRVAEVIFQNERLPFSQQIAVVFCSDRTIRRLNSRYRKIDRATDVLSFNFNDPDLLGELYISPQRAKVQARTYQVRYHEEILRLFIHGIFHLLGYDHTEKNERLKMEKKEKEYLDLISE